MSVFDLRAVWSRVRSNRSVRHSATMRGAAGRQARVNESGGLELLEPRVLLSGDHPSLSDLPTATEITLDGMSGLGFDTGIIEVEGSNDLFKFTAPATDFVRILADTRNVGSSLNSRVRLYDEAGTILKSASGNGVLSTGAPTDAWIGFKATAGATYFVEVLSDAVSGSTATGSYVLRLDGITTQLDIHDSGQLIPDGADPSAMDPDPVLGTLGADDPNNPGNEFAQDEEIYQFTTPDDDAFDSLFAGVVQASNGAADLDSRIDIYDENGNFIVGDSQAGYVTDAWAYFKGAKTKTFFIRVRSDDFRDPATRPSSGDYQLIFQTLSTGIDLDPVTRLGSGGGRLAGPNGFQLFRFTAQGTGLAFVTARAAIPHDLQVYVASSLGLNIGFSDDVFGGTDSEVQTTLTGGEEYFIAIGGFDDAASGPYNLFIEANHTFNTSPSPFTPNPTNRVDDHSDTRDKNATPLVFGPATVLDSSTGDGNPMTEPDRSPANAHATPLPILDHASVVSASFSGRLHRAGDTDVFQFVPPVDMLGTYGGNNDDVGTSLYVGGSFGGASLFDRVPVTSRGLTLWDAARFWFVGTQGVEDDADLRAGFVDNVNTVDTTTPVILAMQEVTIDLGFGPQPVLAIGGDFTLNVYDAFDELAAQVNNLALWAYNPLAGKYDWVTGLGSADGVVRAIMPFDPGTFDPDGNGDLPALEDPGVGFVVGGDFTDIGGTALTSLGFFDTENFAWTDVGAIAGLNGSVRALVVHDFADPGAGREADPDAGLDEVADPPDWGNTLVIGGDFTSSVDDFLFTWNGQLDPNDGFGSLLRGADGTDYLSDESAGLDGPVNALTVWDQADTDDEEFQPVLVAGGAFTTFAGEAVSNIFSYGRIDDTQDPEAPGYMPQLLGDQLGGGVSGEVFALTVWTPPEITGSDSPFDGETPLLIIGGDLPDEGNIAQWDGNAIGPVVVDLLGTPIGFNAPVRALSAFVEEQEQQAEAIDDVETPRQILYIGGEFDEDTAGNPFGHVASVDIDPVFFTPRYEALGTGTDGTVFALTAFDDQNPTVDNSAQFWDRGDRPSARALLTVAPGFGSFANTVISIFEQTDTGDVLIYTNDTKAPPFPDPAGSINRALTLGTNFIGPPLWAGRVYYIEVTTSTNTGRYSLSLQLEGIPEDDDNFDDIRDGDGAITDTNNTVLEENDSDQTLFVGPSVGADPWRARTLDAFGDAENFDEVGITGIGSNVARVFRPTPSGHQTVEFHDLSTIHTIDDSDVFLFTAPRTGSVEVAVRTQNLTDTFLEEEDGAAKTQLETGASRYSSPLDAFLRIYNNDLEQIGFNDNAEWVLGDVQAQFPGREAQFDYGQGVTYSKSDPRVVFNVVQGETYRIVVESAQRYRDGSAPELADRTLKTTDEIDWRTAFGSYFVTINAPSTDQTDNGANPMDDHHDVQANEGTPIQVGDDGVGVFGYFTDDAGTPEDPNDDYLYDGTINRPNDVDLFRYTALASGTINLSINRSNDNSGVLPTVDIFNGAGAQVAQAASDQTGVLNVSFTADKGETFTFVLSAGGGTTGQYEMALTSPAIIDDHADETDFDAASDIPVRDFLGSGTIAGTLENAGDTDAFRFQALDFQEIQIDLVGSGAFNGQITVYEITEDGLGNPLRTRIAANDNIDANDTNSRVTVPVRADRVSGLTMNEYLYYYVVVSGSSPATDAGDYTLNLTFPPTDDHADQAEYDDVSTRDLLTEIRTDQVTGLGDEAGQIEITTDSDAFYFDVPASGRVDVDVALAADSTLDAVVTVIDEDGVTVATGAPGNFNFTAVRSARYYVIVAPNGAAAEADQVGGFTVNIAVPPIDDFANVGEFDLADEIFLEAATGDGFLGSGVAGTGNPLLSPDRDTDLFTFRTIFEGTTTITLTNVDSPAFQGVITVFDSTFAQIGQVTAAADGDDVTINLPSSPANARFYFLISEADGLLTADAEYSLTVNGASDTGGGGGGGDDDDDIDFNTATTITLNSRGDGAANDEIEIANDRDLFKFTAPASGLFFAQVVLPTGSVLNASLTVLNAPSEAAIVTSDSNGIPGATANVSFHGTQGVTYFLLVDGIGASIGSYTVRIDAVGADVSSQIPEVDALGFNHRIFFPEGFANNRIREYVSIANPNAFDVRYSIILRYEGGVRDAIVQNNILLPAGARGGATLSAGNGTVAPGVRKREAYAIEIVSDGPVGATLSHYDFDASTGESFTDALSSEWTFARVERNPGQSRDFILFFNPHNFSVTVTLAAYNAQGQAVTLTRNVGSLRRGGFDINAASTLPTGIFGVTLTAAATSPANSAAFEGIVASISHFDEDDSHGFGSLGSSTGGSTAGAIPEIASVDGRIPEIVLFNPDETPATVDLVGNYISVNLPNFSRRVSVPARGTLILDAAALGVTPNQPVGFTFTSDRDVTVNVMEVTNGDADGYTAPTDVGTQWFFGDAFIGKKRAGTNYFETLSFYNPAGSAISVTVRLLYTNNTFDTLTINVGANDFSRINLHESSTFLNNPSSTNAFSIITSAASPFAVALTHFDIGLGGGWGNRGANIGLVNSLAGII